MARQDITMDAEYGEVETSGNIAGKTFYECRLLDSVEGADNDNYRYCEIVVPAGFMLSYSDSKGIHIVLPYTRYLPKQKSVGHNPLHSLALVNHTRKQVSPRNTWAITVTSRVFEMYQTSECNARANAF